jgi:hypothetical protein
MRTVLSLAALALLVPRLAHADPTEIGTDPQTALVLSIAGSAIPVAAVVAGLISEKSELFVAGCAAGLVMPAAGELYAHHW